MDETYFTVAEVVEYTGRSRAWILKDENKEALIAGGSELGGRGQGSKIPKSLIDNLGWVKVKTAPVSTDNSSAQALQNEIAMLEQDWEDAKEKAGSLGGVIKEKKAELARIVKAEEREQTKANRKALREAEKALAKAREAFEAEQARVKELTKQVS